LELADELRGRVNEAVHLLYRITDRQALLRSSYVLLRAHALELLSSDLTPAFGFGAFRHTITAVAVTARHAHLEEIVAAYDGATTFDRTIA